MARRGNVGTGVAKLALSRPRRVLLVLAVMVGSVPTLYVFGVFGLLAFFIATGYSPGRSPLFAHFRPQVISMLSADEGWVIGWPNYYKMDRPLPSQRQPLALAQAQPMPADEEHIALHRHHGAWSRVTLPDSFTAVQTLAENDAWALGYSSNIYHWDGMRWSEAVMQPAHASNTIPDEEFGVGPGALTMLNAHDGWAVGDGSIWHYTGGVWSDVRSLVIVPNPLPINDRPSPDLRALSFVTATDGWAVGLRGGIWHYDGTDWRSADLPVDVSAVLANVDLNAIRMLSPTEGWAVGTQGSYTDNPAGVVLHYTNGAWRVAYTLPKAQLSAIAMVSQDDGWIGGQIPPNSSFLGLNPHSRSIMRYHDGMWMLVTIPASSVQSLSMDAPDDGWAVADGDEVLHYHNGAWSVALA